MRPLGDASSSPGAKLQTVLRETPYVESSHTMGGMLDKPDVEKHTDRGDGTLGDGTQITYGASAMCAILAHTPPAAPRRAAATTPCPPCDRLLGRAAAPARGDTPRARVVPRYIAYIRRPADQPAAACAGKATGRRWRTSTRA
jgi:hypothetical protein